MPVVINEIVIKATITEGIEAPHSKAGSIGTEANLSEDELKALVETSVLEVLRILERVKQR